ncbi:nitrate- and nitrite sensing domain-containing protein [Prauserella muralis]|uniref:histidine kinase n=1 Tax=Prauserella muralis TaxID=588067 RepID=A0A2V4B6X8_9PSEU|nr:nitrate- and nitrite sensing domain-containing protein [Prauserella muralis]PXY31000.1 histidine kinase [Prauserella muralis]TWE14734.1 signal transduction histidine kinase [Prauserella muralis]
MPNRETAAVDGPDPAQEQGGPQQTAAEASTSRWKLRNWPLRTKLAAVLIIPLVTALTFGSLQALNEAGRAGDFQRTADQVEVATRVTAVVQAIQDERTLAVARMANGFADREALDAQIGRVDSAVRDLRGAVDGLDVGDEDTADRYEQALQRLDALVPLRAKISNTAFPDLAAFVTYTSILDTLVQLGREVNLSVTDRELLRRGTTLQALGEAKEFVARQNAALQIAAGRDGFPADLLERTFAAQASASAALDTYEANANLDEQQLYSDTVAGAEVDSRERIQATAFANAQAGEALDIDVPRLTADGTATTNKMRQVERALLDRMLGQATTLADDATQAAWTFFAIMLAALVGTLVLMLVIARALLKPLRTLRTSALEVAYVRLPETVRRILADPNPIEASRNAVAPVPVFTREEIGEVARSFDVVHERAIRMAAEQALLRENVNGIFVNLSRRSQRLVERQLGVIDRLEADEQDPDQLASLFELDHLATRLRRNGESLLVLSGAGLAKSMSKPVPAADVIGAAVSEIEQYARVEVGSVPEVAVQGRAVHDLVHLLAELLDNATYFSEPETRISVRAVVTRRHALAVQITDRGVGMTEQQLNEANERLADPPDLDVSVTRRMGLYVVARLAKRHGIEVRLRENEDIEGGVIARIVVPTELLTSQPHGLDHIPSRPPAQEISSPSLPPLSSASSPDLASMPDLRETTTLPAAPSAAPEPATNGEGGLTPLAQPISLDDLVGGSSRAAGPFLSPAPPEPSSQQEPEEPQWPAEHPEPEPVNGNGYGRGGGRTSDDYQLALPKREPRYVPVAPEQQPEPEPAGSDGSALEDDVPTRRLPIYQSVLSRWFSEESSPEPYEEQGVEPEQRAEAEADDVNDAGHDAGTTEDDDDWRSVSDSGWQAAHSLLEPKGEEITPAGLPKRVPNAYLVPGSVRPSEGDAFADTTVGQPGHSAIARSADAARNRMASFQRGYQSGRHALREPSAEAGEFDSVGSSGRNDWSADNGAKE